MAHLIDGSIDIIISPHLDRRLIFESGQKKTMILPQAAYDQLASCIKNGQQKQDVKAWEQRWKPMLLPIRPLISPQSLKLH